MDDSFHLLTGYFFFSSATLCMKFWLDIAVQFGVTSNHMLCICSPLRVTYLHCFRYQNHDVMI